MSRKSKRTRRPRPAAARPVNAAVPVELRERDYGFPRIALPASRPLITAAELHQALQGESAAQAPVFTGNALPQRLTAWELELLGESAQDPDPGPAPAPPPVPDPPRTPSPAPSAAQLAAARAALEPVRAHLEARFARLARSIAHDTARDLEAIGLRSETLRKHLVSAQLAGAGLRMQHAYEHGGTQELTGLAASLAAMLVDNAKAQPGGPPALPRRIPGAALASLEAQWRELVTA